MAYFDEFDDQAPLTTPAKPVGKDVDKDIATPTADTVAPTGSQFFAEFDAPVQPPEPAREHGIVRDVATAVGRGVGKAAELAGRGMQVADFDPEDDEGFLDVAGRKVQAVGERISGAEILQPDTARETGQEGFAKRTAISAAESLPSSLTPFAAGAAAGAAGGAIAGPVGAFAGGVLGGAGALALSFFGGTYHESREKAQEHLRKNNPDMTEEDIEAKSHEYGMTQAKFEAGTELVSDIAAFATFFMGKFLFGLGKAGAKESIKQTLALGPKEFSKRFAKAYATDLPFESGSEMVAYYGQATADKELLGIGGGPTLMGYAEAAATAAWMSGGMGVAIQGMDVAQANALSNQLNSDKMGERTQAAVAISKRIERNTEKGSPVADEWLGQAMEYIAQGKDISISQPIAEFTATETAQEAPEGVLGRAAAAGLTPEQEVDAEIARAEGERAQFAPEPAMAEVAPEVDEFRMDEREAREYTRISNIPEGDRSVAEQAWFTGVEQRQAGIPAAERAYAGYQPEVPETRVPAEEEVAKPPEELPEGQAVTPEEQVAEVKPEEESLEIETFGEVAKAEEKKPEIAEVEPEVIPAEEKIAEPVQVTEEVVAEPEQIATEGEPVAVEEEPIVDEVEPLPTAEQIAQEEPEVAKQTITEPTPPQPVTRQPRKQKRATKAEQRKAARQRKQLSGLLEAKRTAATRMRKRADRVAEKAAAKKDDEKLQALAKRNERKAQKQEAEVAKLEAELRRVAPGVVAEALTVPPPIEDTGVRVLDEAKGKKGIRRTLGRRTAKKFQQDRRNPEDYETLTAQRGYATALPQGTEALMDATAQVYQEHNDDKASVKASKDTLAKLFDHQDNVDNPLIKTETKTRRITVPGQKKKKVEKYTQRFVEVKIGDATYKVIYPDYGEQNIATDLFKREKAAFEEAERQAGVFKWDPDTGVTLNVQPKYEGSPRVKKYGPTDIEAAAKEHIELVAKEHLSGIKKKAVRAKISDAILPLLEDEGADHQWTDSTQSATFFISRAQAKKVFKEGEPARKAHTAKLKEMKAVPGRAEKKKGPRKSAGVSGKKALGQRAAAAEKVALAEVEALMEGIKFSKSTPLPGNAQADLRKEIAAKLKRTGLRALERKKLLEILSMEQAESIINDVTKDKKQSIADVKYSKDGRIEGFTIGDKVYLVDGNIRKGEAYSVLLHEMGHAHLPKAFQGKEWDTLVDRFDKAAGVDNATGKAVQAARERVPDDTGLREGETYATLSPKRKVEVDKLRDEEAIAYYLTSQANRKQSLWRKIMAYIKRKLMDFGLPPIMLHPDDVVVMVQRYVETQARKGVVEPGAPVEQTVDAMMSTMAGTFGVTKATLQREFDETKEKYGDKIGIAPNGEKSNLNDHLWVMVRTPRFKEWFGDWENNPVEASKVVDENGEPLVVYHGTAADFSEFAKTKDIGFHFGTSAQAMDRQRFYGDQKWRLLPVFLNIKNAVDIPDMGDWNHMSMWLVNNGYTNYEEFNNLAEQSSEYLAEDKDREAFAAVLKKNGFDGARYKNTVEDAKSKDFTYIAFTPTQIKSIYNPGAFDPVDADIMMSGTAPEWYSRLANLVKDFNVKKQPATAWVNTFNSWKKKKLPPALQEELEWSGIMDVLGGMGKQKVTKSEVLQMLDDGGVKVETVYKDKEIEIPRWRIYDSEYGEVMSTHMTEEEAEVSLEDYLNEEYADQNAYIGEDEQVESVDVPQYHDNTLDGGANYREILISLPNVPGEDYTPTHFSDTPNLLVHVRVDDRHAEDGDSVLMVNEIQSDWGNEARKKGIRPTDAKLPEGYKVESKKVAPDEFAPPIKTVYYVVDEQGRRKGALWDSESKAIEKYMGLYQGVPGVPNAPFIKSDTAWSMLGLKKAITEAVQSGQDYIAWPATAEQVYEIEQWGEVIEEDGRYKNQDGTGDVTAIVNRYLKDLPRNVNRFLKSQMRIKNQRAQRIELDDGNVVNAVELTPEITSKVLGKGMPLFSVGTGSTTAQRQRGNTANLNATTPTGQQSTSTATTGRDAIKKINTPFDALETAGILTQDTATTAWEKQSDDVALWLNQEITGQDTPTPETGAQKARRKRKESKAVARAKEAVSVVENSIMSWEWFMDKITAKSGKGTLKSKAVNYLGSIAHAGKRNKEQFDRDSMEAFTNKAAEIFGVEAPTGIKRAVGFLNPLTKKLAEFDRNPQVVHAGKEEYEVTPIQAAGWLQIRKDPESADLFADMGFTATTWAELSNMVPADLMEWSNWLNDSFVASANKAEAAELKKVDGYEPIDKGLGWQVTDQTDIPAMSLHDMALNRVLNANHTRAWAMPGKLFKDVFERKDVRGFIEQYHGRNTVKSIDKFLEDFQKPPLEMLGDMRALDKLRSNVVTSMIGMNPTTFFKQLTSIPAYAVDIPTAAFIKNFAYGTSHPQQVIDMMRNSGMAKDRFGKGYERDVRDIARTTSEQMAGGVKSFKDILMLGTKVGDMLAVAGGFTVYKYWYDKSRSDGLSETKAKEVAIEKFEAATERTQQSGQFTDIGWIQRHSSLAKLFTMFLTAPAAYTRQTMAAIRHFKTDPRDSAKRLMIFNVMLPMMFQAVASGFVGALGGEEEEREDFWFKQMRAVALGPFLGIPIMRDLASGMWESATGKWYGSDVAYSPVTEVGKSLTEAILHGQKGLRTGDQKAIDGAIEDFIHFLGYMVGLPTKPAQRVWEGWEDLITGETERPGLSAAGYSRAARKEKPEKKKLSKSQRRMISRMRKQVAKAEKAGNMAAAKRIRRRIARIEG